MRGARAMLVFAVALSGCRSPSRDDEHGLVWLVLTPQHGLAVRTESIHIEPSQTLHRVERVGSSLALAIAAPHGGTGLKVRAAGACPLSIDASALQPGRVVRKDLLPWIDFGPPVEQAGYDADVEISAKPGCPEAREGSIAWSQIAGEPPSAMRPEDRGFSLEVHTAPMRRFFHDTVHLGIVPISPRTRGTAVLEARWTGVAAPEAVYTLTVSAASRSSGLPNVAVDHRVYLSASGWKLTAQPDGSHTSLQSEELGQSFRPDRAGHYRFRDESGDELSVFAQRYDSIPLDCGRSECHAAVAKAAAASPMATILKRGLSGWLEGPYDATCAIGCHSAGEPGLHDGGFGDLWVELDASIPERGERAYDSLPAALRRVGGVGCLACHGPGMIPEPAARWAILRADVCAVCHDAPPKYGHVAAWRASRMSRADQDPAARSTTRCMRCHTTGGFLANLGVLPDIRRPPDDAATLGIGCAACHAAHAHGSEPSTALPSLLRTVAVPELLSKRPDAPAVDDKSRICLPCHTPDNARDTVSASAAAIWMGTGGVDPETAAPLVDPAPHTGVQGGCIGCHAGGPNDVERGKSHAFAVDPSRCASCHAPKNDDASIRSRATTLFAALAKGRSRKNDASPLHETGIAADPTTLLGRALYDVLLVLEDSGAPAHNAPYARKLLDAAEAALHENSAAPSGGSSR